MDKVKPEHIQQLINEGYTVIPNVVPADLVNQALRAINCQLGKGITEDEAENFVNGICFKDLMGRPPITHLFSLSDAAKIAKGLLGDFHPVNAGQIAMRFPGWGCRDKNTFAPQLWWNKGWHIDGLPEPEKPNGPKPGQVGNFTCLLGVVLQDVPGPFCGNLVAFPGSHKLLQDHFKQHPETLRRVEQEGGKALPAHLPFAPLRQVTAKAGDITICHYSLAHSVSPNSSPNIRYVVYFRLFAKAHQPGTYRRETMSNIWLDWKGLKPEDIKANSGPVVVRVVEDGLGKLSLAGGAGDAGKVVDLARFSGIAESADKLFEEHKWKDAQPLYAELAVVFQDDWNYQFRAGFCAAMETHLPEKPRPGHGEREIRRAIELFPDFVGGYAVLARILLFAERHGEVLECMGKGLAENHYEPQFAWAADLVVDGLRSGRDSLAKLNRTPELAGWVDKFHARYPELQDKFAVAIKESEVQALVAQGERIMKSNPINWAEGQKVFPRLAELLPDNYFVHIQAAASFSFGPAQGVPRGEMHARLAIEIDPLCLCGYALLARVLQQLARNQEAISAAEAMLNCKADGQHVELAMAGLRAVQSAYQALAMPGAFDQFAAKFAQHYPFWGAQIEQVRSSSCCLM